MKRVLIVFLVWAGGVMMCGYALGWGNGESDKHSGGHGSGSSWQSWDKQSRKKAGSAQKEVDQKKDRLTTAEAEENRRFCSGEQNEELLDLLGQLEHPVPKKMRGGTSEVRWKYRIIRKLRKYDDCRAEDALKRLSKENICEEQTDGEVLCLNLTADSAVEEIKAAADMKKLVNSTPIEEQLKVIRKYTKRPYINDFAVNRIAKYLTAQVANKPEIFVPLVVELFPHKPSTEKIAKKYPFLADKGLAEIFKSKQYDEVWWGINMARYLGRSKFMARINAIAFEKKGNIDYTNQAQIREIQSAALNFFRAFTPLSLPYLPVAEATSNGYGGYCSNAAKGCKTAAMINRNLTDLADNSSGFAVAGSIGKASGSGIVGDASKDIKAILITANASWASNQNRPTVIITGAIHGNEWATPEVNLGIAEYLLENRDNDQPARDDKGVVINEQVVQAAGMGNQQALIIPKITSIKELLKSIQVIIIPVLNPDGYDYSHTPAGKKSYYGIGWRPNRRNRSLLDGGRICYQKDGSIYPTPPTEAEHCFLADYDDTDAGGELEEEALVVCENVAGKTLHLFNSDLDVASDEMFDAIYTSSEPSRVVCASGQRRVWKDQWGDEDDSVSLSAAKEDGYLQESYGVDLNRNYQYKWDVVQTRKNLFIRSRSPSSRMYRGRTSISEGETSAMERLIAKNNVVALIDYHSGSTQVLYPYAYSTTQRPDKNLFSRKWGKDDYEVFRNVSEKIASLLNRHDRGDETIVNYTASQNYNEISVGSGVARDCYYQTEGLAALNIEVHDQRYTYEHEEFKKVVPEICKTNVPGAIWFLFWAAELGSNQNQKEQIQYRPRKRMVDWVLNFGLIK